MGQDAVIKSAGRTLAIFEYFLQKKAPLSVRQIAEQFDYPLSSTAALMVSLARLGYVTYERDMRAYLPTMRLAQIGEWVCEAIAHKHGLTKLVTTVAEKTGETAFLVMEDDIYAHHIYMAPGKPRNKVQAFPGTRRLLCQSAIGWALLSRYPDEVIRNFLPQTRSKLGSGARAIDLQQLMVHVEEVRTNGYVIYGDSLHPNTGVIAMPLPPVPDMPQLAFGVGGYLKRITANLDAIVMTMKELLLSYGDTQKLR